MLAVDLMTRFAVRTGLTVSDIAPTRYLWTDAFAVCNMLGSAKIDPHAIKRALQLVEQVHNTLGRHRPDSVAKGWISGLTESEGAAHPTIGGLRIGKKEPEGDGWDSDGQYFHYLTKWCVGMGLLRAKVCHGSLLSACNGLPPRPPSPRPPLRQIALDQLTWATGDAKFAEWALELADTAHKKFVLGPPGRRRMYWKMSVDLTRPLVASMGQHDPLEGYLTALQLEATRRTLPTLQIKGPDLSKALEDYRSLIDAASLASTDSLGIGSLLLDVSRLSQLHVDQTLLKVLVKNAKVSLDRFTQLADLRQPADRRLAFRELGLAIGLAAVARTEHAGTFAPYQQIGEQIKAFWEAPANRSMAMYIEHADINDVMLATCLAPDGVVCLHSAMTTSTMQSLHTASPQTSPGESTYN